MIEELDQVEEQQQQDPPSKTKVLYDAVSKKYDLGTFDEFEKKLQDPKKRESFYNGVGSEYDLGTYQEFERKVKKKDGGQITSTTTSPTQSPSNPPLKSDGWGSNPLNPASVNFTKKPFPSTTGGMFNDIKEAVIKGKQEYERTGKPLPSFAKEKPKAKDISIKSQASMGLIDPDMKMMPLTFESAKLADNDENRSGYIWNQFLRSAGQIAAGATDLGGLLGTAIIPDEDQIAPNGRKFTDDELTKIWREKQVKTVRETPEKLLGSKVTPEQMEKYGKEFVTSVVGGVAGSALPMLTTGGIGLGLQAYDAGLEIINNSEEGKKLPEWQKTAFGTGVGVAGLFLQRYGMDKIFGKQSSKVALNLMLKTVSGLMKKSDAPITTAALEAALDAGARDLKSRVLKSTSKVASSVAVEGVTGGLQEGTNILAEKIINAANNKLIFEPQSFGEVTGRILNAAKLEAGGGAILGGISIPFSKTRNYIAEKVASARSEEDINNLRREVVAQAEKGNVSEKELNEVNSLIDKYVGVNSKIPDTVPDRKYAADKIIEREELELQIERKVAEKESVDVAFQPEIEAEIEFLSNRVEEINNELVNPPVGEVVVEEAVAAELPDTYIINGKPVSQQEFDTAIDNAKNTKEALDVEYNGDDEVRIQKIIDLGGTTQAGTTTITDEAPTTTTEVTKPVQHDAGVPEQQGTKEAVSESTEPIGQGNAETTTTVLEKGNSVGVGGDVKLGNNTIIVDMSLPFDSGVNTGLVKNSKGAVYHDKNTAKLEKLGYSKEQIDNLSQTELNEILAKNIENPNVATSAKLPIAEEQITTQEFLNEASKDGGKFAELAKALKQFFGIDGVKTEIVKGLKDFFGKNNDGDYANNKIRIDEKAKNKLQTFLHEAIHKVTVDKLLQFERGDYSKLSKQDIEAIQNLIRIFNESKVKIHEFLGGGKGDRTKGYYGFTNVHEFISEAFTNPEFQSLLRNLPTEGKTPTIFKQFLDAVAKFFGTKDASILNDIFHHTENLREQSLKETTKAETVKQEIKKENEAKKADIERRKQEELKDELDKKAKDIPVKKEYYKDTNGNDITVTTYRAGNKTFTFTKSNNVAADNFEDLDLESITPYKTENITSKLENKINAKYEAELKTLEQSLPTKKQRARVKVVV